MNSLVLAALLLLTPAHADRVDLAAPTPRTSIVVDGVTIALHDTDPSADLPALVCLHAVGHGGGDFTDLADALSDRYRLLLLDWPGHGASGVDHQPTSARRYADLLTLVIDELGLQTVTLLGNSIGGAAAITYAAEHPERVSGLILSNPGGLDKGGAFTQRYLTNTAKKFQRGADGDPGFQRWYTRYYSGILVTADAAERRAVIIGNGYEMAPVLTDAWESFAAPEADLRALLPQVTAPTLVAWASEDRVIRWSRNAAAIEQLPNTQVIQFQAGHSPFLETPEAFTAELERFLVSLND